MLHIQISHVPHINGPTTATSRRHVLSAGEDRWDEAETKVQEFLDLAEAVLLHSVYPVRMPPHTPSACDNIS